MSAPHLPPKSCNLKVHQHIQSLPIFLVIIFVAVLAGAAAAISTTVWITPPIFTQDTYSVFGGTRQQANQTIDPTVANETKQKIITIFDTTKKNGAGVYPETGLVARAALVSSDGWVAMFMPNFRAGREKLWEGIDTQGISHKIERVIADPNSGLLYLKLSGEGFRIMSFDGWNSVDSGSMFWSFHPKSWKQITLTDSTRVGTDGTWPIWRSEYQFGISSDESSGSIVLSDRGALVGFVDAHNRLIPSWLIEGQLSRILTASPVRYDSVPWEGYMIAGATVNSALKSVSGFYVSRVTRADSLVQKGDIILRIRDHLADATELPHQILISPADFSVTVLRNGEEKEIVVKKLF